MNMDDSIDLSIRPQNRIRSAICVGGTAYGYSWGYATEKDIKRYPNNDGILSPRKSTYAVKTTTTDELIIVKKPARGEENSHILGMQQKEVKKPLSVKSLLFSDSYNETNKNTGFKRKAEPDVSLQGAWYQTNNYHKNY
jgi:hypothetical protein